MALLPTPLLLLLLHATGSSRGLLLDTDSDMQPVVHRLMRYWQDKKCDRVYSTAIPIDGSMKLVADATRGNGLRICKIPLVPFGELVHNPKGMRFWYLRLRITQLVRGQVLYIAGSSRDDILAKSVDQRHDLDHKSHTYPVTLHMNLRYVRLFWNSSLPLDQNPVNITLSRYAIFNSTVNTSMQQALCERYGYAWCNAKSGGVCVSPNSCSLQDDCFDTFTDPPKCPDAIWIGGNLTSIGSRHRSWFMRNLQWLALGLIPIILVFALAKICSQKRDLDIDDDYDYKLSCGDDAAAGGDAESDHDWEGEEEEEPEQEEKEEEEREDRDARDLQRTEDARRETNRSSGTYYSYPSVQSRRNRQEMEETLHERDEEEEEAPSPPPRLRQAASEQVEEVVTQSSCRELELTLEEEDDFFNVSRALQPAQCISGEYTKRLSDSESSPRASYTQLLRQASPVTEENLLMQPLADSAASAAAAPVCANGVVSYTELMLPPPNRVSNNYEQQQEQQEQQQTAPNAIIGEASSSSSSSSRSSNNSSRGSTTTNDQQQQESKQRSVGRSAAEPAWTDSYNMHYIVV